MTTPDSSHDLEGSEIRARAAALAESGGFPSIYRMCIEKGVDYQALQRVFRSGLSARTTLGTVNELKKLGFEFGPAKAAG